MRNNKLNMVISKLSGHLNFYFNSIAYQLYLFPNGKPYTNKHDDLTLKNIIGSLHLNTVFNWFIIVSI